MRSRDAEALISIPLSHNSFIVEGEGWCEGVHLLDPSMVRQPARPSLAGRSISHTKRATCKRSISPPRCEREG